MCYQFAGKTIGILIISLLLAGCNGAKATHESGGPSDASKETALSTAQSVHSVHTVSGRPYVEAIELPGASVHGYETTLLMAKLGGYVDQIMNRDGKPVDKDDPTDKEIDIGSRVNEDAILAELDIPEMAGELKQKQALVAEAKSAVLQAAAAVTQAEAEVESRRAEVDEAKAMKAEKVALQDLRETAHKRVAALVKSGAVRSDNLLEAEYAHSAAKAAVRSADAAITKAASLVTVAEQMVVKARADKESAAAHVDVANANLEVARAMNAYSTIRAPYDGMITKRWVDNGAFVRPATSNSGAMAMFEITRTDRVRVEASVPSVKASRIGVGKKAVFHSIGGLPGVTVTGQVGRTATALDQKTRMMQIHVDFTNPLKSRSSGKSIRLDPGMYGSIRVIINEWDKIPVVPASALAQDDLGQSYVMVVDGTGLCKKRPVEIGFNDAKEVGIRDGLEIGDRVVSSNVTQLTDGEKISIESP